MKKVVLTGDRPTGKLHLGHFVGSLSSRLLLQKDNVMYILVADVQALTDNFDNPEKINSNILETTIDNLAVGLDPKKTIFFIQSQIPQIAELTIFFMNLVSHEKVIRNPTVKDEIKSKFNKNIPFGFVAYPISQAADILILRSDLVPVGDDQKPMIELSREIADKFNKTYKSNVFPLPEGFYSKAGRLVGIDGSAKMSKSLNNAIFFADSDEEIKQKVLKMYTDPNRIRSTDPGKVDGNPVFIYHDLFNSNKDEVEELKNRYSKGKVGDVEVKQKLYKALIEFITPIREKRKYYEQHKDEVWDILFEGTKKVLCKAQETIDMVKSVMKIKFF